MAAYFLDTSALVKLYIREVGTGKMVRLATRSDEPRLIILSLSRVELHAAILRRFRSGELSTENLQTALASFNQHLSSVFVVQPVTEPLLERAVAVIDAQQLRAYDAIQLAACLTQALPDTGGFATFVSADRKLLEAAKAEGLSTLDPSG
ncbi:MAG TPA: type II toxin-antitoxin system VapC family toxin [Bryobacteraceae bacterium]|nr:type II toxin-antitoxin system VapC family toxin [Bryobacteraceae bacterium]